MRSVVLALVLPLLGACLPAHAPSHSGEARELQGMTVALVDEDSQRIYCSAVWVGKDKILTAAHCVEQQAILGEEWLRFATHEDMYRGERERHTPVLRGARIVDLDMDHDLALLEAEPAPEHPVAEVSSEPIEQGDEVQVMGHSLGLGWSYSRGDVAAVRWLNVRGREGLWLQTTAPASPGNSGGGAFDKHGHLIGICHGGATRGQLVNLFVHRAYLAAFLGKGHA